LTALVGARLPIRWRDLGFPDRWQAGAVVLEFAERPAWSWSEGTPRLTVPTFAVTPASIEPGWAVDHVVVLVADLDRAVAAFTAVGLAPRLRMRVSGRPAAFFRAGPVLEVVESPVRETALYGVALVAEEPLGAVALRLRSLGIEVDDPRPATQPGRRIMSVRNLGAGLAIMSPDGPGPLRSRR